MLAFLTGELLNSAKYFQHLLTFQLITCVTQTSHLAQNLIMISGHGEYHNRLSVSNKVGDLKGKLSKTQLSTINTAK